MATKPKKPAAPAAETPQAPAREPTYSISHCNVTNGGPANKHTRAAVVALAEAVSMNARALIAIAEALKGAPATMESGFRISGGKD